MITSVSGYVNYIRVDENKIIISNGGLTNTTTFFDMLTRSSGYIVVPADGVFPIGWKFDPATQTASEIE